MGVSLRPDRQADILSTTIDSELEFGPLSPSSEYIEEINGLIHPVDVLRRAGYTLQKLSPEDIDQKRRCFRTNSASGSGVDTMKAEFSKGTFAPPCVGNEEHTPRIYAQGELERQWNFFHTPPFKPKKSMSPAAAVVIDCEMGTNMYGESELIRVSVIDYFSRAILLDSLVWPDVKMVHYNTRFSGVTRRAMQDAKKQRTCLFGRASVRKRIWEFVGPQTIVIGHAAHGDLASLRWIHARVVDTLIIETRNRPPPPRKEKDETAPKDDNKGEEEQESENEADKDVEVVAATSVAGVGQNEQPKAGEERRKEGGLSLKALAQTYLSRTIQIKGQGHDSVEDALATRDILHWNVVDIMRKKKKAAEDDDDDDDEDDGDDGDDDDDDEDEEETFQVA
ncbi:RNA exonuclease 3 [Escovopsis weberi]|uniref:RNA exonuclease 3 n=1 Tax=Escovopsis weberi TaxID=150374 RepID=A0A0M8MVB8_ESCWE|nr:RNA exonuclease 3 [Escovopsis weberi]